MDGRQVSSYRLTEEGGAEADGNASALLNPEPTGSQDRWK